jgi:hypothetical protein
MVFEIIQFLSKQSDGAFPLPQVGYEWNKVTFFPTPPDWQKAWEKFWSKEINATRAIGGMVVCVCKVDNQHVKEIFKDSRSLNEFLRD